MDTKAYQKEYYQRNKATTRDYYRLYRQKNKIALEKYRFEWRDKLRLEVLLHYGNGKLACVQCGFNDVRALSIDHIENNGAEERKTLKPTRNRRFGGIDFYSWLKQHSYPKGYQTLCMNCQWIKRRQAKYADRYLQMDLV